MPDDRLLKNLNPKMFNTFISFLSNSSKIFKAYPRGVLLSKIACELKMANSHINRPLKKVFCPDIDGKLQLMSAAPFH